MNILNFAGKKVSALKGIVIILFFAVTAGNLVYYYYLTQPEPNDSFTKITRIKNENSQKKIVDPASWNTYVSPYFSLKYPGQWSFVEKNELKTVTFQNKENFFSFEVSWSSDKSVQAKFNDFKQYLLENNLEFKERKIPLVNTTATEISYIEDRWKDGKFYRAHNVYFANNGLSYDIYATFDISKEEFYEPIFYTMLSSFQFK